MPDVTSCGLCGSEDLRTFLDLGFQPLAERFGQEKTYPLALVRCHACTLVQLDYIVDQAELFPPDHPYATGNSLALKEHYWNLAHLIRTRYGVAMGRLAIDIGANDGTLCEELHHMGYDALGVEPTGQIGKLAGMGIKGIREFFTWELAQDIRAEQGPARIITANNVLAHVPDPHNFITGVVELMDPSRSVFITENHDVSSVTEGLQYDTIYHEHLRYYSLATLSRLLSMHGLDVTHVERTEMHGGSFRVTARLEATDVQDRAASAARGLHDLVRQITDDGGVVYGVGATTRATPLIHYAELQDLIEQIADVPTSDKIGRFLPGTKIPVVNEEHLIADQPSHALLLAHHLGRSLVHKLRAKGYKGEFIWPIPPHTGDI